MSNFKNKKKTLLTIFIILALVLLLTGIFFIFFPIKKLRDMQSLSKDTYNSVFVSMYSIENYSEEAFSTYRGLDVNITTHSARNISELTDFLDIAFRSDNIIDTVYIGLDPYIFYCDGNLTDVDTSAAMNTLFDYIIAYPGTTFEILLPAPAMEYWLAMDDDEIDGAILSYRNVIACLEPHDNIVVSYIGNEEWLINNPSNYTNKYAPNALISEEILRLAFCDRKLVINMANADAKLGKLREIIYVQKDSPVAYPDLSDKTIVFFGDSILGLQNGSYSIPGVINAFTDADVYNYAIGGTTACNFDITTDSDNSFTDQLNKFLNHETFYTRDDTLFPYGKTASEDLIFVINYGYNDYMCCLTTESFGQALDTGISRLQTEFPEAQIIIMVPYENIYSSGGIPSTNEDGESLSEYATVARQIATERSITCLDIPSVIDVNEANSTEYFRDGCHYNEYGRYRIAQYIISVIE